MCDAFPLVQFQRFAFVVAAVWLSLAVGCGGPAPEFRVSGQVVVNRAPASGVYVLFYPAADPAAKSAAATTQTGADGSFIAKMPIAGKYAVTVFWPKVTIDQGESIEGEDRFQGRYRYPQQPVASVSIEQEQNSIPPIILTSP